MAADMKWPMAMAEICAHPKYQVLTEHFGSFGMMRVQLEITSLVLSGMAHADDKHLNGRRHTEIYILQAIIF